MVDGPFTRSEAAERCRCKPEELCPGPLAGIDESDKIIQAHTEEKTTAPMVGDCLYAIHWVRTAADLLRAPSSGTDEEPRDVHQAPQVPRALRGTPTAPACFQVPRALIGAGG